MLIAQMFSDSAVIGPSAPGVYGVNESADGDHNNNPGGHDEQHGVYWISGAPGIVLVSAVRLALLAKP
jgi:hypothetical protein